MMKKLNPLLAGINNMIKRMSPKAKAREIQNSIKTMGAENFNHHIREEEDGVYFEFSGYFKTNSNK